MSDDQTAVSDVEKTAFPLKVRLYVMMFLQYFVQGCYLPIISVYLQDALGFDGDQIGVFGSALAVGPLVAPFIIGQVVDRHAATQKVLSFCHLSGGVIMLALYYQTGFWPVVILGTLYSTLYVPSLMLTNSLTFHHLVDRDREFPPIRLWGTIGFVVPAWLIEMYFLKGLEGQELNVARGIALALAGIGGVIMGLYSLSLPDTPPKRNAKHELAPGKVLRMLKLRSFFVLVSISLLVAIVHKFYFVWNSPFLKALLEKGEVASAWAQRISSIGQISEVAVMAGLSFAILKLGFKWTMTIGAVAYMFRCLLFAAAATLQEPFSLIMTLACIGQAMHGLCFGCFLAAAFMFVDRVSTADVRGSMQNFYGTFVLGVGFFLGGFISGRIGGLFTTSAETSSIRDRLGFEFQKGITTFTKENSSGYEELFVRDWLGIWLAGAALAAIALYGFVQFFPNEEYARKEESEDEEETSEQTKQP